MQNKHKFNNNNNSLEGDAMRFTLTRHKFNNLMHKYHN